MPDTPPIDSEPNAPIDQGPDWLIDIFLSPPPWVNPLLQAVAVLTVAVVAYRLYQWDGQLPVDVQREMQIVAGHVVAITTATLAVVNLASLPYYIDVTVGFAAGYGLVLALQRESVTARLPLPEDNVERVTVVWAVLAAAAVVAPSLAATNGVGIPITKTRYMLAAIAVGLFIHNAAHLETDRNLAEN